MQIIPDGGSANIENQFVGLPRELRVDISNWDLRLHDGVTHGGLIILNRDNADARYQAASDELSGFSEAFEAADRGVLTRRGAADYRVRFFQSLDTSLIITNPDGHDGDFNFELNPILPGDYVIQGDFQVLGEVEILGGINGDTNGTHYGNVVGDVTGDLTGNAHGNHTGSFAGDVDVRGNDLLLDDDQIPASKINGLGANLALIGVPVGGIIMYSGSSASIPANWKLCNGSAGTPNLVDMFIKGGNTSDGASPKAGETGGAKTHQHTTASGPDGGHDHGIIVSPHTLVLTEIPSHQHDLPTDTGGTFSNQSLVPTAGNDTNMSGSLTGVAGGNQPHSHAGSQSNLGAHSHVGTSNVVNHEPQFFVLAYIMRIG